jgi:mRNA interferase MazF
MVKPYIPNQGDIVMLNCSPQRGKEQAGTRPALVMSRKIYHERSGLMLCCPLTSQEKGYPFEVKIPVGAKVHGVILVDQVRSFDFEARGISFVERLPTGTVEEVFQKIQLLVSPFSS